MNQKPETLNLILAVVLSTAILLIWQFAYEMPRQKIEAQVARQQHQQEQLIQQATAEIKPVSRDSLLVASPRLPIRSGTLHGSIALKGLRFDDLTLAKYRETVDAGSPEVKLLSPAGNDDVYFAQIGWLSSDASVKLPDENSVWTSNAKEIAPGTDAVLSWNNGQGLVFHVTVGLDEHYMFTLKQQVENHSAKPVTLHPYGFINRSLAGDTVIKDGKRVANARKHYYILHEGPLGVFDGVLNETTFQKLKEEKEKSFDQTSGWLGITDKYWLSALAPEGEKFTAHYSYYQSKGQDRYQADYAAADETLAPSQTSSHTLRLFAGAKELPVLDAYAKQFNITLFDRAVDFGIYWFLTIPLFHLLNYLHLLVGNFGVAILILTVLIKLVMFPLANKSYTSMSQMKRMQPQLAAIKERAGDDKMQLQKEMLALYKREKVNPAAGCLPMLIQIPVFFSLYKVLFVTIEMRQAPFIGWIHDLSVPDPLNVFTLFGLIHWTPPTVLHLGILPILFCLTMIVQQKLNPPPADPTQAKVMAYMPYMFLFLFASFPAGLVIYWTWSNLISILQQKFIMARYNAKYEKP